MFGKYQAFLCIEGGYFQHRLYEVKLKQIYLLSLKYVPLDVAANFRFYYYTSTVLINRFFLRIYTAALIQIIQYNKVHRFTVLPLHPSRNFAFFFT